MLCIVVKRVPAQHLVQLENLNLTRITPRPTEFGTDTTPIRWTTYSPYPPCMTFQPTDVVSGFPNRKRYRPARRLSWSLLPETSAETPDARPELRSRTGSMLTQAWNGDPRGCRPRPAMPQMLSERLTQKHLGHRRQGRQVRDNVLSPA